MREILDNSHPKIPNNSATIRQFVQSGGQNRKAFAELVEHINLFDFEDRKKIQELVIELLGSENGQNELVMVVKEMGHSILESLLSQYEN